jgi:hypothetical protein
MFDVECSCFLFISSCLALFVVIVDDDAFLLSLFTRHAILHLDDKLLVDTLCFVGVVASFCMETDCSLLPWSEAKENAQGLPLSSLLGGEA